MAAWGGSVGGKDVALKTLRSDVLEVDITNFGATLVAVRVKSKGEWLDVLMGYESLDRYTGVGKPNFGSVVGRCANRIAGGTFELDGQTYELDRNNGPNHLHGGTEGFWQRVFDIEDSSDNSITLSLTDPDGTMGYPGNVNVRVMYEVNQGEFHFRYEGVTDKPTLLSMTNHGYWNLKGHGVGDVLDHNLMVAASRTTAVDGTLAITGELPSVDNTGLDLRGTPKSLREAVGKAGPIDANYCLDVSEDGAAMLAAKLVGPNGITMDVWTDQPGIQVYTGNFIAQDGHPDTWWHGKGATWQKFGAICLEPQLWPDGIHQTHFKSPVLRPGEVYKHHSWHVFTAE